MDNRGNLSTEGGIYYEIAVTAAAGPNFSLGHV
jgi:hypothetical protein